MSSSFSSSQIAATVIASNAAASSSGASSKKDNGGGGSSNSQQQSTTVSLWEQSWKQLNNWVCSESTLLKVRIPTKDSKTSDATKPQFLARETLEKVWKTLESALSSIYLEEIVTQPEEEGGGGGEHESGSSSPTKQPARKRRKRIKKKLVDPYNLWVHVKRVEEDQKKDDGGGGGDNDGYDPDQNIDVPDTPGGKLSVLSVGGLLNAMAGITGGVTKRVTPSADSLSSAVKQEAANGGANMNQTGVPLTDLLVLAHAWHRAIQLQVHRDILSSTPRRIQEMLCADLTEAEFASIRKRIYDTVLLGKGLHTNDPSNDVDPTLATGPTATAHDIEKFKKCQICGENDQASFVVDRKNGDVICSNCGAVVSESIMHEGSQFRKFEGEVDRNHHGDTPNPLYSNAHNLSTSLSGVQETSGAGAGGWRSGGGGRGGRNLETILRNAHAYTELNISQFGNKDRRTRTGYKDRQKKEAFVQMAHTGDALNLHEAVVQRAKELFAGFRDDRELVQQFKGVIAACLCEAFEQLSAAGKQILKAEQGAEPEPVASGETKSAPESSDDPAAAAAAAQETTYQYNKRAARRNELHHNNLAGRGGLLLDFSAVETKSNHSAVSAAASAATSTSNSPTNATGDAGISKPAVTWDLDDCRRWLLEASRQIAQEWSEANGKKVEGIPSGSQEELEGRLVEHTFELCEHLETELQSKAAAKGKRVVTPRVTDLAKLGIQWQHKHERGAGSKTLLSAQKSQRTAGQILILKTAAKLGSILKDPMAGEAIHKKLREVVEKQETLKNMGLREEASRQRLMQMKRKPWLQARLQS